MEHYAGLDVSVKETSVCIIDAAGKVTHEVKVATDPKEKRGPCDRHQHWIDGEI